MATLVEKHHGNLSAMAADLGTVDRQTLSRKLARMNLLESADQARSLAGIKGPRIRLEGGSTDPDGERTATLEVLSRCHGYRAAAAELNISPRTMVRKMRRLGITGEDVAKARTKTSTQ